MLHFKLESAILNIHLLLYVSACVQYTKRMNHPHHYSATLGEHLRELKQRVVWALLAWLVMAGVCYWQAELLLHILTRPLQQAMGADARLVYLSLPEAFLTRISLSMQAGFLLAFPIISLQAYLFLAPGLYRHEKRTLLPYMLLAPLLFSGGVALAYFVIFPMAWEFFAGFETSSLHGEGLALALEARLSDYLDLVLQLVFAFGLSFQIPLILMLLSHLGVLNPQLLRSGRRYAVVILLILAAILTPPDIMSQVILFIPLYLLYEGAILGCARVYRPHHDEESTIDYA